MIGKAKLRNHRMINDQMVDIELGNSQIMFDLKKEIENLKLKKSSIKEIGEIKKNSKSRNSVGVKFWPNKNKLHCP